MPTINLSEASPAELRDVAMRLGLEVSQNHTGAKILSVIKTAFDGDEYIIPEDDVPSIQATSPGAAPVKKAARIKPNHCEIIIPAADGEQNNVQVYVNGRSYIIMRDTPVIVPNSVVEVLQNAKQARGRRDRDQRLVGFQDVMRWPFTILERGEVI
jgi:hypothetical protein